MIEWVATGLSIGGIVLNARKRLWCWPVWILSNLLWIYYFMRINVVPAQTLLNVVFALANMYGYYYWTKAK